ncbi:Uncharacterised protein [Rodentibacter pneumotropicus]|uniref:Uncharacterized protein n=1 Tax=Rodentibacter pneumotropicus TaxID=758 RepID=A0A3S5ESD6_9PAST|nr:Uncharacterised protein [Rodentibacter pneumotropicus]
MAKLKLQQQNSIGESLVVIWSFLSINENIFSVCRKN